MTSNAVRIIARKAKYGVDASDRPGVLSGFHAEGKSVIVASTETEQQSRVHRPIIYYYIHLHCSTYVIRKQDYGM